MTVFRYLFKQIFVNTVVLATGLLVITWITQSIRLTDLIVNHAASIPSLLSLVVFLAPDLLTIILPITTFIAIIITYHRLAVDHELVVMRTMGWSELRIAAPAITLACGVMTTMIALNFYIIPLSFQNFSRVEQTLRNRYSASLLHGGEFSHLNGLTILVEKRSGLKDLHHIFIYDDRQPDNPVLIAAERGQIQDSDSGLTLSLTNGLRQASDPLTHRPGQLTFSEYTHHIQGAATPLEKRRKKSTERFISELFFIKDEDATLAQRNRYFVEGWQRIVSPLWVLAFTAIALELYVRRINSRRNNRRALVQACGAVFSVQLICFALIQMSAHHPWVLALVGLLLMIPIWRCIRFFRHQSLCVRQANAGIPHDFHQSSHV